MAIIVPAGLWLGLAVLSIASPLNIPPLNSAKSASTLKRQIDVGVSLDGICTNGDITTVVGISTEALQFFRLTVAISIGRVIASCRLGQRWSNHYQGSCCLERSWCRIAFR
jgi:hypothetical protein